MTHFTITLDIPPSVNVYWRHANGRHYISKAGLAYRQHVGVELALKRWPSLGTRRAAIDILVYEPDRRRRDLDNMQKALLDALEDGGVVKDDSQFDDIRIRRMAVDPELPRVVVTVTPVEVKP